jgi:nitrile hydratase
MRVAKAKDVPAILANRKGARVDADIAAKFQVGDAVHTRNINPLGHTRLPRFARARQGVIVRDHGVFVFPDESAQGRGPAPQHLYSVRFTARELWGDDASALDTVHLDLWDEYLDPA